MLTDRQRNLWEAYEKAESRAPRAEKLAVLGAFLDSLDDSPDKEWFPWARSVAEQVVDDGLPFVIRMPLFERAVFPALVAGYHDRLPGCARWLAGLADHLWRGSEYWTQLGLPETTELGLLQAAIRHDPADRLSRLRLIKKIADRLSYALHEIPAGVLYGMDGASPVQCEELEEELQEFCRLASQEGIDQDYAGLIAKGRLHFRAYRDFLLNRERYSSYQEYLSQNQLNVGK